MNRSGHPARGSVPVKGDRFQGLSFGQPSGGLPGLIGQVALLPEAVDRQCKVNPCCGQQGWRLERQEDVFFRAGWQAMGLHQHDRYPVVVEKISDHPAVPGTNDHRFDPV